MNNVWYSPLNLRTYEGGEGGGGDECHPPKRFFKLIFEKTIYFKGQKPKIAVHPSSEEILICHCVSVIFDVAMAAPNFT